MFFCLKTLISDSAHRSQHGRKPTQLRPFSVRGRSPAVGAAHRHERAGLPVRGQRRGADGDDEHGGGVWPE